MKDYMTNWIWLPEWNEEDNLQTMKVDFRKLVKLDNLPSEFFIQISATSRYKLYVNKKLVEVGPCKGDNQVWYYDSVDLVPFLRRGTNVLAIEVLHYSAISTKGNRSIFRPQIPGLYVRGSYQLLEKEYTLVSDETWVCQKDKGFQIIPETSHNARLQFFEKVSGQMSHGQWKSVNFDDTAWLSAKPYNILEINKAESPGNLLERPIPSTQKIHKRFSKVMSISSESLTNNDWSMLVETDQPITIPPHTTEIVEIDAGELMNGFVKLALIGGNGTNIKLTYAESYSHKDEKTGKLVKKNRVDFKGGEIYGFSDSYQVAGYGQVDNSERYEPFWFRTFRFIKLEIQTQDYPLIIDSFDYQETGYPIDFKTKVETSDPSHVGIWDISRRTLKRCMMETYMDCPYYEQLQYIMDTRSQALYTYAVAADDRLARQSLDDFRRSQGYDGLLNACYPSVKSTVIPGFSIYYILMLADHMMYFGDKELLEDHWPTVERILHYFTEHLNEENLVEKIGGQLIKDKYWSFIDWTPQWNETAGVPSAINQGALTMESLLFILGLQTASRLADFIGNSSKSKTYQVLAEEVSQAVNNYCRNKHGVYLDGPGVLEYSQHAQVFAILTGTVSEDEGRKLLDTALHDTSFAACSVAMMPYLFEAIKKVGLYEQTNELWQIWRDMLANNLTTCVEDGVNSRSDCHAWGALILYELPAVTLGVRPIEPGFKKAIIDPEIGYLSWARGQITTPYGMIEVSWTADDNGLLKNMDFQAPSEIEIVLSRSKAK